MTTQEIFDTVARHLLTQRKPAVDEAGECQYRAPNGLKCAAGALIPDELYTPDIEGHGMMNEALDDVVLALGLMEQRNFICDLQAIHDHEPVHAWADDLRSVAFARRLSPAVVDELS